jgi:uncharacterized membrane protein YozB (DUF420 family)
VSIGLTDLPAVNVGLNGAAAVLLAVGRWQIKRRRVAAHRVCMLGAFAVSILFLASYLTYHAHVGSVRFTGPGALRPLLITHTLLAAAVPILAGVTLVLGLRARYARHVRIAKWTLPIWLYVSVTGVIVYLMLYRLFPAA